MAKQTRATSKSAAPTRARRAGSRTATLQVQAARPDRWNARMERTFLDELAVTCNVRRSLALVGKSPASLYYRRRTVPGFAAAWDTALNEGYAKLEAAMISRALSEEAGEAHEGDPALKPMPDSVKLTLLAQHAKSVAHFRTLRADADVAKLKREITQRLDRLARSLGLEVKR
jgi:hypothetical protein